MNEKIFIVTDGCMWEINKDSGNEHPHAMEVVDMETGAVRYIQSGSRIKFVEGKITDIRLQKTYNEKSKDVSDNQQGMQDGTKRKGNRKK